LPYVKRRMHIKCREDECLKLYELLKDKIPALSYVRLEMTSSGLLIEAYGYESEIKELWFVVRKTLASLREVLSAKPSKKYSVDLLVRMTRKTFPPEVLVEVLRARGHHAEFLSGEGVIVSSAPLEEVVELANKVAELNREAGRVSKGTSTRYFIAACSAILGTSVDDVVKISLELNILREDEGKYTLTREWRKALNEVLKALKRG
jgi:hypothetical protein